MLKFFSERLFIVLLVFNGLVWNTNGQDSLAVVKPSVTVAHGSKGFEFKTTDNRFMLQIQSRLQLRFATLSDQDPITLDDYTAPNTTVFRINRARLKVGGHAYKPWLKYYWEYELGGSNLLDFRLMIEKWEWLSFKAGQWKIEYTQERFISSGKQQLVDRSILNRPFTVDRQQGVEVYGHLKGSGALNFNYWIAGLTGTGRGSRSNDDENLMYFGRFQWNFLGREMKFEGSDVKITPKAAAFISLSAITNQSSFTRFSSSGGGNLAGFDAGNAGQYRTNQMNLETALKYKGFSWQSELHNKEIIDLQDDNTTTLLQGYYVQAGYFFHQAIDWWPAPLELAARHSAYYPDSFVWSTKEEETAFGANWFFDGHANKLSVEVSRFTLHDFNPDPKESWRLRVQWDISL